MTLPQVDPIFAPRIGSMFVAVQRLAWAKESPDVGSQLVYRERIQVRIHDPSYVIRCRIDVWNRSKRFGRYRCNFRIKERIRDCDWRYWSRQFNRSNSRRGSEWADAVRTTNNVAVIYRWELSEVRQPALALSRATKESATTKSTESAREINSRSELIAVVK